jgi:hypothetical protein
MSNAFRDEFPLSYRVEALIIDAAKAHGIPEGEAREVVYSIPAGQLDALLRFILTKATDDAKAKELAYFLFTKFQNGSRMPADTSERV